MSQYRILVTAAGGALAPMNIQLMKAGERHDIWVAAVDTQTNAAGRYFADAFETVPYGGDDGYVEAIAAIVERHSIDLVLPWSDEEALSLSGERERIENHGAILACTDTATLQVMNDKAATFRALSDSGLPVPSWDLVEDRDSLVRAVREFRESHGDYVVKPTVARGNRGTFVIADEVKDVVNFQGSRELHMDAATFENRYLSEAAEMLPVMVMERLFAPAYDIDVLANDGKLLRAMPRERLNPAGMPFMGGILRPADPLMEIGERVTAALKLNWLYDYDLMTDASGQPVVIELNPRPSGSIAAAILAGVPFFDDLVSMAKGETLPYMAVPVATAIIPYTDCRVVPLSDMP